MANVVLTKAKISFLKGEIALLTDTIKVLLLDNTFVPAPTTDQFVSGITAHELSGGNYARQTLANKTVAASGSGAAFDADDISIAAATFTTRYAAIVKDTGSDATSRVIGYVDFLVDKIFSAETAKITWDAAGILTDI